MTSGIWSDTFLDDMRLVGDPPADAVIQDLVRRHDVEHVNQLLRSLVRNDDIVIEETPQSVRAYLAASEELPDWTDWQMIQRGESFFDKNWPVVVTLLFCASLPSAYAAHKGAQVLHLTQRLTRHVHRRIFETAQFILDVMAPGGLSPQGRGIRSAQKVRLIHAAIRQLLEHEPRWRAQWNDEWGTPINQEDLAGTLMTFSLQILLGMKRFRIPMEPEDEEAYLHTWKVVGHLMGVQEALLPANVSQAHVLATTIFTRQKGSSEAGLQLAGALLDFMDGQLPGRLLDGFPATLIRHSIDHDVADLLQVPRSDWTSLLFALEDAFFRLTARFEIKHKRHSRVLVWLSYRIVQELVKIERGGNRSMFRIPPGLRSPI